MYSPLNTQFTTNSLIPLPQHDPMDNVRPQQHDVNDQDRDIDEIAKIVVSTILGHINSVSPKKLEEITSSIARELYTSSESAPLINKIIQWTLKRSTGQPETSKEFLSSLIKIVDKDLNQPNVISKLKEMIYSGFSADFDRWRLLYATPKKLEKLSDLESLHIVKLLLQAGISCDEIEALSPRLGMFSSMLNLKYLQFKAEIDKLQISQEMQMAMVAQYIDYHKAPLRLILHFFTEDELILLSPHLTYVDLSEVFDDSKVNLILSHSVNAATVTLRNCSIKSIPTLPACVSLNCSSCSYLETIEALPVCMEIDCNNCPVLKYLPESLLCTSLNCSFCKTLEQLPDLISCTNLDCSYTNLKSLPQLLACIHLRCLGCEHLEMLPQLDLCESLDCSGCKKLTSLGKDLPSCVALSCSHCLVEELPSLPICKKLKCPQCPNLKSLPILDECVFLDCDMCPEIELPELPVCEELNCGFCNFENMPELPRCKKLNCNSCKNLKSLPLLLLCEKLTCSFCEKLQQPERLPVCLSLECRDCGFSMLPIMASGAYVDCSNCSNIVMYPELANYTRLVCDGCPQLDNLRQQRQNEQARAAIQQIVFEKRRVFRISLEGLKINPKNLLINLNYYIRERNFPYIEYIQAPSTLDGGGVTRDFVFNLCKHLFIGKGDGYLTQEDQCPLMQEGEEVCYQALGKLFAHCCCPLMYMKTGPIFSADVYKCLSALLAIPELSKVDSVLQSLRNMSSSNNSEKDASLPLTSVKRANSPDKLSIKWFLESYTSRFSEQVVSYIFDIEKANEIADQDLLFLSYSIDPSGCFRLTKEQLCQQENHDKLYKVFLSNAMQDKSLWAIFNIGIGMQAILEHDLLQVFCKGENGETHALMNSIEGVVDKQSVIKNLNWSKSSLVNEADYLKTQNFLFAWLANADDFLLRKFLQAVTGSSALIAKEIMVYVSTGINVPQARTCVPLIELYAGYLNQAEFDKKLMILMDHESFQFI